MSAQILELESILRQMIAEHHKLLKYVEAHAAAMQKLDYKAMDEAAQQQEALRLRLMGLETKRKNVVTALGRAARADGTLTVSDIARLYPQRGPALLKLRAELKGMIGQIGNRLNIAGRVASALLGHLNTVVRLVAGAVEGTGIYTKSGVHKIADRIGAMNAIG
jgi:hypothetical protein